MDQSWRKKAACIGVDYNLFFAPEKHHTERKTALTICKGCSVRMACLRSAIEQDDQFIRGGTTYEQRKIMSVLMLALTPISSSLGGSQDSEHLIVEHTVQVSVHTFHIEIPEQSRSFPIPPFELNQSVLGVSGIRPLLEVLHSQAEPESSPSLASLDFSKCLVISACS